MANCMDWNGFTRSLLKIGVAIFAITSLSLKAVADDNDIKNQKIAIVGAGASGLTAAYLLKKQGYDNVTVFEKKEAVGGVAHTIKVDGKYYDLSTMFVPGGSIAGDGIQPLIKEMIDVAKMKLIPAVDFETLNLDLTLSPMSTVLQAYTPEELRYQLLKGLTLMSQFAYCLANGIDSVSCGITLPGDPTENIHAWGARNGVPAFTHLITFTADALGAGPSSYSYATSGLYGGFQWTPVEVVRILKSLGVSAADLPAGTPPNIVSLMSANDGQGSQRWWFFKKGYQNFWKALVHKTKIKVKLSEPVVSLALSDGGWSVTTSKKSYHFDRVVVATTPRAAMYFLPESPQKDLLSTAIVRTPPNDVFISRVSEFDNIGFPDQVSFWTDGHGLGSFDLIDPALGGVVKPFFWQKRHKKDIMMIATYTLSPLITPEQAYGTVQAYAAGEIGFNVGELIAHERFFFPPSPADRAAWSASWPGLQGKDGLFFIGEAFTGSGVPAIAAGLTNLIPQFFPQP